MSLARDPAEPDTDQRCPGETGSFRTALDVDQVTWQWSTASRIRGTISAKALHTVYQPIIDVHGPVIWGYEALTRFPAAVADPNPAQWFRDAARVGLGCELELAAIESALRTFPPKPRVDGGAAATRHSEDGDPPFLCLNVSAELLADPRLMVVLHGLPLERIVLELTENTDVMDYGNLHSVLREPRAKGLRLAVDDTGSGYAGIQHLLHLAPDLIKLDTTLTQSISTDPASRAMVSALHHFATDTGAALVAEGIETQTDLVAVTNLGIRYLQGFLLGRPEAHAPQTLPDLHLLHRGA